MIAIAPALRGRLSRRASFALAAAGLFTAAPLQAQLAATVSLETDYRLRGYSVTDGRPAVNLDLAYDDPSGLYADVNATARLAGGPGLAAAQGALGYARAAAPGLSMDAGVLRLQFTRQSSARRWTGYTELYVGLSSRRLSARAYYSPDYFGRGVRTLYTEADIGVEPVRHWRLAARAGRLTYLNASGPYRRRHQYDWLVSTARDIGKAQVYLSLSGGGPSRDFYRGASRSRTALVLGARFPL